jgi:hypothetical protein
LPETSAKWNSLLQLEAAYKTLRTQFIDGTLSNQDYALAENKLRKRLLEFIDSLEADDFAPAAKRSRLREDHKVRQGHVLYRTPHQMQVDKETRCLVRIAFDKAMLLEDLQLDEDTKVRSEVRISLAVRSLQLQKLIKQVSDLYLFTLSAVANC